MKMHGRTTPTTFVLDGNTKNNSVFRAPHSGARLLYFCAIYFPATTLPAGITLVIS